MSDLTALDLARVQFAFTVSFHILFPAITIGLGSYLAVLEGLWLARRRQVYQDLYHFWSKIFALNFGMGVVSGLVMAYEFGTNWSGFSAFAGGITGPLLTYEVLTAFFLEAGFLGVMLFGWNKVGPGLHFFATLMVAAGTLISATWILASNSWMQTPQGYTIVAGRVVPINWWLVIFNPSFPYRLVHMTIAAYLATALFVGASGAWALLKGRNTPANRTMLSMAMWMALIVEPIQVLAGDAHGLNTLKYQPAKIAAIEGHWENTPDQKSLPLILVGWPDIKAETTRYALEVPYLGSLILTHSLTGRIPGLKEFPREDRPNSTVVFWTFRLMVGLGMAMVLLGLCSAFLRWRGRLYDQRLFLRAAVVMGPAGLLAILAGWVTTEMGRQPWVVYGVMRTKDAVSNHSVASLSFTLTAFVVVYFAVFGTGVSYMLKLIARGPDEATSARRPMRGRRGRCRRCATPSIQLRAGMDRAVAFDLPTIWALIIAFGLMMYVVMDEIDLGIGILFPFIRDRTDRDTMVNTVAPVWDGNETWLVLGGAALLAAFPLAYSVLLSALYLPLVAMLIGLIWRGVAFEFRFKADEAHRPFWDQAFAWGSYIAAVSQGVCLGAFITGFRVTGPSYGGGAFEWLTPFSLFTGVGVVIAYALLGCTWLILKTDGALHARMAALVRPILATLLVAIGAVSLWTPLTHPQIAARWFTMPGLLIFSPVPILVAATGAAIPQALSRGWDKLPFLLSLFLIFLGYSGLGISLWPHVIPPDVTIAQAAGPSESLSFTLVGAVLIIPCILGYTTWAYYVFRGKVKSGEGYH